MPRLYSRLLCTVTLVIYSGLFVACASAAETDLNGRLFQPSTDPLADVQQALDRADDGDRLTLVVLGANWCHDSRALASRLHRPPLAAYEAGNAPEEFDASWNELRDFRMAIPDGIRELRDEAQRRVSEGEKDIQLKFPEYPLLSWESE